MESIHRQKISEYFRFSSVHFSLFFFFFFIFCLSCRFLQLFIQKLKLALKIRQFFGERKSSGEQKNDRVDSRFHTHGHTKGVVGQTFTRVDWSREQFHVVFDCLTVLFGRNPPYRKRWRLVYLPIVLSEQEP